MEKKVFTGVFLCSSTNGLTDVINISEVAAYVKTFKEVSIIWNSSDIQLSDTKKIADKIKEKKVSRFVIAGDMPGIEKNFFSKAMILAGNEPKDVILASFREHGAITSADTARAKAIITCAIYGVPFEEAALPGETDVNTETLVIGGGIAGIQASLEIADSGNKVYLVEKTATIGGHMATFDKTFPTLDCAACILTPKMVEVGQHSNIELMTYCEVKNVSGEPGNYKVKILKKAFSRNV